MQLWPACCLIHPRLIDWPMMKIQLQGLVAALLGVATTILAAGDSLPTLKAGDEVYSNVTVTTVTATDIYFSHSRGMGNAKLKSLDPELQKRFKFDPEKAGATEKQQAVATARFHMEVAARNVEAKAAGETEPPVTEEDGDPVVTKIYARSFRGQRPPQIILPEWATPPPAQPAGKFALIVFWTTGCEPCRNLIPQLNELQAKFSDQLVIIGLSDESVEVMRKLTTPKVEFSLATDPEARTRNAVEVQGIPHAILIDPKETVRFEGQPAYLNEERLEHLISKYSK